MVLGDFKQHQNVVLDMAKLILRMPPMVHNKVSVDIHDILQIIVTNVSVQKYGTPAPSHLS